MLIWLLGHLCRAAGPLLKGFHGLPQGLQIGSWEVQGQGDLLLIHVVADLPDGDARKELLCRIRKILLGELGLFSCLCHVLIGGRNIEKQPPAVRGKIRGFLHRLLEGAEFFLLRDCFSVVDKGKVREGKALVRIVLKQVLPEALLQILPLAGIFDLPEVSALLQGVGERLLQLLSRRAQHDVKLLPVLRGVDPGPVGQVQ